MSPESLCSKCVKECKQNDTPNIVVVVCPNYIGKQKEVSGEKTI